MQTGTDPTDQQTSNFKCLDTTFSKPFCYDGGQSNRAVVVQLKECGFLEHRYYCGSFPSTRHNM